MRIAFIVGSNGVGGLKYAVEDARRLAECLSSYICGFKIVNPPEGSSASEIRALLFRTAEACRPDDTFLCYFSGHGGEYNNSAVYLMLDNTTYSRLLSTALWVVDIVFALNYCRASKKLLILDCCHSGALTNMSDARIQIDASMPVKEVMPEPENYAVLLASGRFEKAREFEFLQGSFLTSKLVTALCERTSDLGFGNPRRISVSELERWLQRQAREHNKQDPEHQVPIPRVFGQPGEMELTWSEDLWEPFELTRLGGIVFVVLPLRRPDDKATCIGKHPITNDQYQAFVNTAGHRTPVGKHNYGRRGEKERWLGPFYPWKESVFSEPDVPVVCVSLSDALCYCEWATHKYKIPVRIPHCSEWDYAVCGPEVPDILVRPRTAPQEAVHQNAEAPATIDRTGDRSNKLGVSDMIGNVWEWCVENDGEDTNRDVKRNDVELRGGSFMENVKETGIQAYPYKLKIGKRTQRSNIGFRVVVDIPVNELPKVIQERLLMCQVWEAQCGVFEGV